MATKRSRKKKGMDGKACWKGYKLQGTKMKNGKKVDWMMQAMKNQTARCELSINVKKALH